MTAADGSLLLGTVMTEPLLLHSMLGRLKIDIGQACDFHMPCLEQAVRKCMICANTDACSTWLQAADDPDAWQMFCPIAQSLEDLPRS